MFNHASLVRGSWGCIVLGIALLTATAPSTVLAQSQNATSVADVGRVDFDFSGAPPATVEVDISQGMLVDISGIGQAAIGGAVEALLDSSQGDGHAAVKESAEHLRAVNEIVVALTGVVREVRVRVYDGLRERAQGTSMAAHYQQKLEGTDWDSVVRVRDNDTSVNVSALRRDGAIRGLFVVVADGNELVIANIVCELTPDRIRHVTNQATRIGMKFGLEKALQQAMREIQKEVR